MINFDELDAENLDAFVAARRKAYKKQRLRLVYSCRGGWCGSASEIDGLTKARKCPSAARKSPARAEE